MTSKVRLGTVQFNFSTLMVQSPDEKYFDQRDLAMAEMIDETNITKNTIMHILKDRCLPCCN